MENFRKCGLVLIHHIFISLHAVDLYYISLAMHKVSTEVLAKYALTKQVSLKKLVFSFEQKRIYLKSYFLILLYISDFIF